MNLFCKFTILLFAAATLRLPAAPSDVAKVTGTVVDEKGKPVVDVSVDCYHFSTRILAGLPDSQPKLHTTTDGKGLFQFSVPSGAVTVVVKKAGFASVWKTWETAPKGTVEPLVLTSPTSIAGIVVDEKGQPIANAEVSVSAAVDRKEGEWTTQPNFLFGKAATDLFSARASADGHFRIADFPAGGQANLAVTAPGRALRTSTTVRNGMQMEAQSGQEDIKLVTEPAASVEGKLVTRDTGEPLANSRIQLQPINANGGFSTSAQFAYSGVDGSFHVSDVPAGAYQVQAIFTNQPLPLWVAEMVPVTVTAGQTARDVKVQAFKGGVVEVFVVGKADQKGVTDVNVSAYSDGYPVSGSTGNDGIARFRLPPGRFTMFALKQGLSQAQIEAFAVDDQTNRVKLELDVPARIVGTVRDSSGSPVPDASVSVVPNFGGNFQDAKTDADGHYELTWQKPSGAGWQQQNFYILARHTGRKLAAVKGVDDAATSVDLDLKPGISISGRVQDVSGKPITNAMGSVVLQMERTGFSISRQAIRADKTGHLQIDTLPAGENYSVSVSAKGYGSGRLAMDASSGQSDHYEFPPVTLKLADHRFAGKLLGTDGQPIAGVRVWIQGDGQPSASAMTDVNGHFDFDAVCEGRVTVTGNAKGLNGSFTGAGGDTNVTIRLNANNNVYNSPGSLTVSGTVFDPSGSPAPHLRVAVTPAWGPDNSVTTGANGEYTVHWMSQQGMPNVKYYVIARDPEKGLVGIEQIDEKKNHAAIRLEPGLSISGTVQDWESKPLPGANINLNMFTGNMGVLLVHDQIHVDEDGAFTIPALPKGQQYNVQVSAKDYGSFGKMVAKNQSQTNSIKFPPIKLKSADRELAGQVIGEDGKPVSDARIYSYGNNQPNVNIQTDSNGHFKIKVCEGLINLNAFVPQNGSRNNYANVQARGGDMNVILKLGAPQQQQRRPAIRTLSLKPQPWTLSAVVGWSLNHKATTVALIGLQAVVLLGTTSAALFVWMAGKRKP